ncbi:MAG: GNAT family N-acetyltransferase [Bacteroidota bacterium]
MKEEPIKIRYSEPGDTVYSPQIHQLYKKEAENGDIGLAVRSVSYLNAVISEGKGVFAFYGDHLAGFCYIETWEHEQYLANSGLIVVPELRGKGVAKKIKFGAFQLSRKLFPHAKLFGLTTNSAVMRINADLGYIPVTFSQLTQDPLFWRGCESCQNYDILLRTGMKDCLCTAMIFDPNKQISKNEEKKFQKEENRARI